MTQALEMKKEAQANYQLHSKALRLQYAAKTGPTFTQRDKRDAILYLLVKPKQQEGEGKDITLQKEESKSKEFKSLKETEKHNALKDILGKAQITNILKVSHKNNSHYWTIDGMHYRVSDHRKPKGSFGEEYYRGGAEKNDFRNYDEFYDFLKSKIDLSDKSELENEYKKNAANYIKKIDEETFQQPDGSLFSSMDTALNNMWRLKKELPIMVSK